ncbi:MAG: alpha/beta hydrolase [Chloroflexota bacterium]
MRLTIFAMILSLSVVIAAHAQELPPAPGELFEVNGQQMHLSCTGEGEITVLIEAGVGGFSLNFSELQGELNEHTRVCSYDRLGYGWSDPLPNNTFDLDTATANLHNLFNVAEVPPPYLVISHSFGAAITRAYHAAYPGEIVGMVFLDAVHPDLAVQVEGYSAALERQLDQLGPLVALIGNLSEANATDQLPDTPAGQPAADVQDAFVEIVTREAFLDVVRAEGRYLAEALPTVVLPSTVGELPLVVVTHGMPERFTFLGAWMGAEQAAQAEETWQALQRDLTTLAPDARLVVATESRHSIHQDQPELVVSLVLAMLKDLSA